jgi:hypothetical protein
MCYCLVAKVNNEYAPIYIGKAKYDCVELGLECMAGVVHQCYSKFNCIPAFEVWTGSALVLNLNDAIKYYTMGYHDVNVNVRQSAKSFGIKAASLEYIAYETGMRHARNPAAYKRLF